MILSTYLVGLHLHRNMDAGLAQKCRSGWLKRATAADTGVSGPAGVLAGRKGRSVSAASGSSRVGVKNPIAGSLCLAAVGKLSE